MGSLSVIGVMDSELIVMYCLRVFVLSIIICCYYKLYKYLIKG